jgi:hypothetical protein
MTVGQRATTIIGVIGSLSSLLAILPIYSTKAQNAIKSVVELPPAVWWTIAIALLLGGLWFLRKGVAKHSRLKPGIVEIFRLVASNPDHLKGRKDDIDRLADVCEGAHLVFLTGESGAGKSSLLQAGLSPSLRAGGRMLPIYLDVWGKDWDAGPRAVLRFAIWEALTPDERQALGLTEVPAAADISAILRAIEPKLQRTPVLLLDQFDDYQTLHRAKFLPRKTWLSPLRLAEKNSFWRDVKQLIEDGAVRCLIATRNEAAGGLHSVEFIAPESYQLDRLHSYVVGPLLDQLAQDGDAAGCLIENPKYGWEHLKGRLADDLERAGGILPIQMRLAFRGLESLRTLTEREYDEQGGLTGLEAAHIERQIKNTAANTWGLDRSSPGERGVLALLVALVNRKDNDALKTTPRTDAELKDALLAENAACAGPAERLLPRVLDDLKQKELVRSRTDPDTRAGVWLLDHDYLCQGVLEAERRADVWPALLKRRAAAYKSAGRDAWARGQSRLKPSEQVRLAWERLRGRLRYREDRVFAIRCLARSVVPYALLGLVLAGASFGVWRESREAHDRITAHEIWSKIGSMPEPGVEIPARPDRFRANVSSPEAVVPLWELAQSPDEVRFRVLDLVFRSHGDLSSVDKSLPWRYPTWPSPERREQKAAYVLQAIVGLHKPRRDRAIKVARESYMRDAILASYPTTLGIISDFVAATGNTGEKELYREMLLGRISNTSLAERDRLSALSYALNGSTYDRPSPNDARAVIDRIIASLDLHTRGFYEQLATEKQAFEAGEVSRLALREGIFFKQDEFVPLLHALDLFQGRLAADDKDTMDRVHKIRAYVKGTASKYPSQGIEVQGPAVPAPPAPSSPQEIFSMLFSDKVDNGVNCYQALEEIPDAIQHYPGSLPAREAMRVFGRIVALWGDGDTRRWNERSLWPSRIDTAVFCRSLCAVAKKLASEDSQRAADLVLAVMDKTNDVDALKQLASSLNELAGGLPVAAEQRRSDRLLAAMEKADSPRALATLAEALKSVSGRSSSAEHKAFDLLLTALENVDDVGALQAVSGAIKGLPGRVPAAAARRILAFIAAALYTSDYSDRSHPLAQTLRDLPATFELPALVELAKHPLCVGEFRDAVLEQMEKQSAPVKFQGDLWKMVDWLEEHEPSIDLKSPPKKTVPTAGRSPS